MESVYYLESVTRTSAGSRNMAEMHVTTCAKKNQRYLQNRSIQSTSCLVLS